MEKKFVHFLKLFLIALELIYDIEKRSTKKKLIFPKVFLTYLLKSRRVLRRVKQSSSLKLPSLSPRSINVSNSSLSSFSVSLNLLHFPI